MGRPGASLHWQGRLLIRRGKASRRRAPLFQTMNVVAASTSYIALHSTYFTCTLHYTLHVLDATPPARYQYPRSRRGCVREAGTLVRAEHTIS